MYVVSKTTKVLHVSGDFSARENKQLTQFKMICISFAAAVQTLLVWAPEEEKLMVNVSGILLYVFQCLGADWSLIGVWHRIWNLGRTG